MKYIYEKGDKVQLALPAEVGASQPSKPILASHSKSGNLLKKMNRSAGINLSAMCPPYRWMARNCHLSAEIPMELQTGVTRSQHNTAERKHGLNRCSNFPLLPVFQRRTGFKQ